MENTKRKCYIEYFGADVMMFTGEYGPVEDFLKEKDFKGDYEEKKTSFGATFCLNPGYAIWIKYNNDQGVVAHEIFHCIDFMLRDRGMELSDDSNEAWAYGIQALTNHFYNGKIKE